MTKNIDRYFELLEDRPTPLAHCFGAQVHFDLHDLPNGLTPFAVTTGVTNRDDDRAAVVIERVNTVDDANGYLMDGCVLKVRVGAKRDNGDIENRVTGVIIEQDDPDGTGPVLTLKQVGKGVVLDLSDCNGRPVFQVRDAHQAFGPNVRPKAYFPVWIEGVGVGYVGAIVPGTKEQL